MKIKNIRLHLIVLFLLTIASFAFFVTAQEEATTTKNIFLDSDQDGLADEEEKAYGTNPQIADTDGDGYSDGAEVKSGYDPLKKSPGDKLVSDTTISSTVVDPTKSTLTQELANKISILVEEADANNEKISLDQVKSIVSESLDAKIAPAELPAVSPEDITVKQQDYAKLPEEEATAKKKEDFTNYVVGLSYVLSSNSPTPVTSTSDINNLTSSLSEQLTNAITIGDASSLQSLATSGEKVLQQMQAIEVPEELVETHSRGLQLAKYAIELQGKVTPSSNDPVLDITNYSKMQNLIELMMIYSADVQEKFNQYGLVYDDSVQNKLQDYGINIMPDLSQNLTP